MSPRRDDGDRPSNPGASSRRLASQGGARTRPAPGGGGPTGAGTDKDVAAGKTEAVGKTGAVGKAGAVGKSGAVGKAGAVGKSGARRSTGIAASPGSAKVGQAATTYRGVRWERNTAGRLRWHDDDGDRWVLWRPGQDAPPRPPGWAEPDRPLGTPLRDKRARASWRSPYRLVPLALAVAIVIFGIVQATSTKSSPSGDAATQAAQKLLGQCLATAGTSDGQPIYEAGPVACDSSKAAVKVVRVLVGTSAEAHCPTADSSVRLADPGAASPPVLCVSSVRH